MIYHSSIVTQNAVYLENNSILENSNNPNDPITLQIAKVANSKKLSGKTGSNTHLSMFANQNTLIEFIPRNDPE